MKVVIGLCVRGGDAEWRLNLCRVTIACEQVGSCVGLWCLRATKAVQVLVSACDHDLAAQIIDACLRRRLCRSLMMSLVPAYDEGCAGLWCLLATEAVQVFG